jgi:hypothetical protein
MAEVKRILNVNPSKEVERDWQFEHADEAGKLAAPAPSSRRTISASAR